MDKVVYDEDSVFSFPTGALFHEHVQGLREELDRMEMERDNALLLLKEVAEAESNEELDDILVKIREFVGYLTYNNIY